MVRNAQEKEKVKSPCTNFNYVEPCAELIPPYGAFTPHGAKGEQPSAPGVSKDLNPVHPAAGKAVCLLLLRSTLFTPFGNPRHGETSRLPMTPRRKVSIHHPCKHGRFLDLGYVTESGSQRGRERCLQNMHCCMSGLSSGPELCDGSGKAAAHGSSAETPAGVAGGHVEDVSVRVQSAAALQPAAAEGGSVTYPL